MGNPKDGIDVSRELLEHIQGVLDGGTRSLSDIAQAEPPGVNAGGSTSTVAETMGLLLKASAGVAGGMQETTQDIRTTRDQYMSDDAGAADLFGNP